MLRIRRVESAARIHKSLDVVRLRDLKHSASLWRQSAKSIHIIMNVVPLDFLTSTPGFITTTLCESKPFSRQANPIC